MLKKGHSFMVFVSLITSINFENNYDFHHMLKSEISYDSMIIHLVVLIEGRFMFMY